MPLILNSINLFLLFSPVLYIFHSTISLVDEIFLVFLLFIWGLRQSYTFHNLKISRSSLLIFVYFACYIYFYDLNIITLLGVIYLFKLPIILSAFLVLVPYADHSRRLTFFFKRLLIIIICLNLLYLTMMALGLDLGTSQKYGNLERNMGFFPNAQRNSFVICFALIGVSYVLKLKSSLFTYGILAISNLLTFSKKDQIIHILILRGKFSLFVQLLFSIPVIFFVGYLTFVEYSKLSIDTTIRGLLWIIPMSNFSVTDWFIGWGPGCGRYVSTIFYSQLYYNYGLAELWGASPEHSTFISDGYWPHVLGEIGLLVYVFKSLYN